MLSKKLKGQEDEEEGKGEGEEVGGTSKGKGKRKEKEKAADFGLVCLAWCLLCAWLCDVNSLCAAAH